AEDFAVRWQRFYQTGMVCLYLAGPAGSQMLEAVVVQNLGRTKNVTLAAPEDLPVIPRAAASKFAILNGEVYAGWLFEQLEAEFDIGQTRLMPLLCKRRAVGAIVFELRYPGDIGLLEEQFRASTSVAASVLDMAVNGFNQQRYAEQFVQVIDVTKAEPAPQQEAPAGSLSDALAEMAGGAGHELNNPLSVISGRAQLLAQSETDPEKQRILTQIQENSSEISGIINDLMTFAKPASPRASRTDIRQMLDEAVQLTSQKADAEHINVQIKVSDGLTDVFVDSGQTVSAIANVVCNALESYTDKLGPVKVSTEADDTGRFVRLQISDLGCGMNAETVGKATQPFFSGKAAGRKRGMGLAHAKRLIELNGGSLTIESAPDSGTTVTISLPVKSEP
ncbi:MAG: sensor histidine kinase, partial [Planctomycetota bacterium]